MIRAAVLLLVLVCAGPQAAGLAAAAPPGTLADPRAEARAEAIGHTLRCLVCQNEDIEESGADLARDLRGIVRAQVAAGRSDREVTAWMVARYGNFIRLSPPFTPATVLLWLMPALALLAGAGAAARLLVAPGRAPAPLDADERRRLASLLRGP